MLGTRTRGGRMEGADVLLSSPQLCFCGEGIIDRIKSYASYEISQIPKYQFKAREDQMATTSIQLWCVLLLGPILQNKVAVKCCQNNNLFLVLCNCRPRSRGYEWGLIFWRLWVWIPALYKAVFTYKVMFSKYSKSHPDILATFERWLANKNFQKAPNLVTLNW